MRAVVSITPPVPRGPERYTPKKRQAFRRSIFGSLLLPVLFLCLSSESIAQARLVMNGANIVIRQSARLVIENPASNAITRTSGHIISEGTNNVIKWYIGTTTGTYTIPWGYGSSYLPLTFTKTAGSGSGHFLFSTYHTGWQNSAQLPTGVSSFNGATGTDNSAFAADRFWQINAVSYSTKPTFSDLTFTYLDAENTASGNTIAESGLIAKRYNSTLNSWTDDIPASTVNATSNTVTVSSVSTANLQSWWALGTQGANRYWVAPSNSSADLTANWSETAGGAGNASVPTTIDAIVFDGTSDASCSLSAALTAASLAVDAGYTGTISQGANTITLGSDATFSGGAFTGGTAAINVGGNFTVSGTSFASTTSTLDVKGSFSVTSGSFAHNNGTVAFSGTGGTTQNVSSTTATTFNNISVTNTSVTPGASIESNQNLAGTLTLAGNVGFDADGSSNTSVFKLLSAGDGPTIDGAIAALPSGAQVSGQVTVQRYMSIEGPNSGKIYRYIASPVQQGTVADLQQEIPVTGTFTGRSTCSGCNSTQQSLFAYNEAVITDTDGSGANDLNDGYGDFPDAANTEYFTPGKGYALYVRGNLLSSTLWDLRGNINAGNVTPVSFPVTYTSTGTLANDGWNLVGNPFPSTIDWNAASGWTKTNLEGTIYITDNGSSSAVQVATWNGVTGTNGGSRHIAIGQGFWVKANGSGAPVLQANENIKAAGTQTTFFREEQPSNLLRITMVKGTVRDETVVHFRDDATSGFDAHADARKFANATFNFSSALEDGKKVAINSLPKLDCESTIALNVDNVTAGSYRLDFSGMESFPAFVGIRLTDKLLGTTHDVRAGGSYSFSVTSNPASYGAGRFKVSIATPALNADVAMSAVDICEGGSAVIKVDDAQSGVTYEAMAGGNSFRAVQHNGETTITVPKESLQTGENRITVRSAFAFCNAAQEKEIAVNVAAVPLPVTRSAKRCGDGSVTLEANGAPEQGSYNWYETETSQPIESQHASAFVTPSLVKSKTYYVSTINALGCESARKPVEAVITRIEDAAITLSRNVLRSNYAEGNQWYLDGVKIGGATDSSLEPRQSGTYKVEVSFSGCITSAEYDFVIMGIENDYRNITVSPNPVRHEALVEVPDSFQDLQRVRVLNSMGQMIGTVDMHQNDGRKTGKLQLGNYPSGLYIIQVISGTAVKEFKVIKE